MYCPVQTTEAFGTPGAVARRPGHTDLGVPCRSSAVLGVRPPPDPQVPAESPCSLSSWVCPLGAEQGRCGSGFPKAGGTGGPVCPGTRWAWILQVARSCQPRGERELWFGLNVWPVPVSPAMFPSRGVSSPLGENGHPGRNPGSALSGVSVASLQPGEQGSDGKATCGGLEQSRPLMSSPGGQMWPESPACLG